MLRNESIFSLHTQLTTECVGSLYIAHCTECTICGGAANQCAVNKGLLSFSEAAVTCKRERVEKMLFLSHTGRYLYFFSPPCFGALKDFPPPLISYQNPLIFVLLFNSSWNSAFQRDFLCVCWRQGDGQEEEQDCPSEVSRYQQGVACLQFRSVLAAHGT